MNLLGLLQRKRPRRRPRPPPRRPPRRRGQDEILVDVLAFLEVHAHQLAVDLGADGHGVEGAAGADAIEINRDILLPRRSDQHRHGRLGGLSPTPAPPPDRTLELKGLRQVLGRIDINRARGRRDNRDEHDEAAQPTRPACGRGGNERCIDAVGLHARAVSLSGRLAASRAPNLGLRQQAPPNGRSQAHMRSLPATGRTH